MTTFRESVSLVYLSQQPEYQQPYVLSWSEYLSASGVLPTDADSMQVRSEATSFLQVDCKRTLPDFATAFAAIQQLFVSRSITQVVLSLKEQRLKFDGDAWIVELSREVQGMHPDSFVRGSSTILASPGELLTLAALEQYHIVRMREAANQIPLWHFRRVFPTREKAVQHMEYVRTVGRYVDLQMEKA